VSNLGDNNIRDAGAAAIAAAFHGSAVTTLELFGKNIEAELHLDKLGGNHYLLAVLALAAIQKINS
jgi:hypothetical protein